jgi:hypothetical protein
LGCAIQSDFGFHIIGESEGVFSVGAGMERWPIVACSADKEKDASAMGESGVGVQYRVGVLGPAKGVTASPAGCFEDGFFVEEEDIVRAECLVGL